MVAHTKKTVYVCLHDAEKFGETPTFKLEINIQDNFSHRQMVILRERLESFITHEVKFMQQRPEYSGAWPNG